MTILKSFAQHRGKLAVCIYKMNQLMESLRSGNIEAVNIGLEHLNVGLNDSFKEVLKQHTCITSVMQVTLGMAQLPIFG